jgi:hypothetical protein
VKTDSPIVPDLLRRFVETPYTESFMSGDTTIQVETNDPAMISGMRYALSSQSGFETDLLAWKLVRDEAAPSVGKELTVLRSGPLSILRLGMGTLVAVDHERREVMGFIAPDLSAEEFATVLLPEIGRLRPPNPRTAIPIKVER